MTGRLASHKIGLALLAVLMLSIFPLTHAAAVTQLPAFYYGKVTISGPEGSIPALPGSTVAARSGSDDVTPVTLSIGLGGRYGGPTGSEDKLLVQDTPSRSLSQGDSLSFFLNGIEANEGSTFESGSLKRLDLTVADNQGPGAPQGLLKNTPIGVNLPSFSWEPAVDLLSGVSNYAVRIDDGEWLWLKEKLGWTATKEVADGRHTLAVKAKDGVGNVGAPSSLTFEIDTALPAVVNPLVGSLGENSAIISWSTNKPALSWFDYGLSAGNYVEAWSKPASEVLATNHVMTLTGLSSRTTYHYRIRITDAQEHQATTGDLFFTTLAPTGPGSINLGGDPNTTSAPVTTTTPTPSPYPAEPPTAVTPGPQEPQPVGTSEPQGGQKLIDEKGIISSSISLSSEDRGVRVDLAPGIRALDMSGDPLAQLLVVPLLSAPPFPNGVMLSPYDFQPQGATFSPPVPLTFKFSKAALPQGYTEESLRIAYFDTATAKWTSLPTVPDIAGSTVSTLINRFAPYALVAEDVRTSVVPVPDGGSTVIDRIIERAIWAAAALLAFIASLVALIVVLRMRHRAAN